MRLHFIVGTGRCGSSLVHELLANHEQVHFVSNVDDNLPRLRLLGRFNSTLYALTRGAITRKGRLRFAPSEAYRVIRHEVSPIYEDSCRDLVASDVTPWLRRRFRAFFEDRWRAQGGQCFLHKYTGWPRIGFFSEIFPEARFIHVVRDGRAVANSLLQMDWWGGYRGPGVWRFGPLDEASHADWVRRGQSFVALAGLSWRFLMEGYMAEGAKLGPERFMEVRYEDFVNNPVQSLRSMVQFLGLPWSTRIERVAMRGGVYESRRRAFETDLAREQVAELEGVIGPMLARYGYS